MYRSYYSASGLIMKTIKCLVTGGAFTLSIPTLAYNYVKLNMAVMEMYLEEDGEHVVIKTTLAKRTHRISNIKALDKETFVYAMDYASDYVEHSIPVYFDDRVYIFDRNGIYYHPEIMKAIMHNPVKDKNLPMAKSPEKINRIETSEFMSDKVVTEVNATEVKK